MRDKLPAVDTDSAEVYFDPDVAVAHCPARPRIAKSKYGFELRGYDMVRSAFRDPRLTPRTVEYYVDLGATPVILDFLRNGHLNFMEPERHDRIRSVISKAFTYQRIEAFRPVMRDVANELIDDFIDQGEFDVVGDFCHMLPIGVLCRFIGVPSVDVPRLCNATVMLRMLGQVPFKPGIPALEEALNFLYDYVSNILEERRAEPKDDFIGALVALQQEGAKLSEKELVWGLVFLLLGGHDTTRFTLAGTLHSLIETGFWEDVARRPELIPDAIVEGMRYRAGTPRNMRLVREALEIEGVQLQPGDVISLSHAAAGRDPGVFPNANEFQCPREGPAYQIGFGVGRHNCIGQILAKAEMAEAIEVLTSRIAEVEIIGEVLVKVKGVVGGIDSIPVKFSKRS